MAYSSLATVFVLSPNRTSPRNHKIDTVTIHCTAGQTSAEALGAMFAAKSRKASSNYGIGKDGEIGVYVPEEDRCWCSSNAKNDHRSICIECSSDFYAPYEISQKVYDSLITLLVDICHRNGIEKLVWSENKEDRVNHKNGCNMTVHRDYAAKACPGEYLYNLHGKIAADVNSWLESRKRALIVDEIKVLLEKLI